jgi:hypothetical protein
MGRQICRSLHDSCFVLRGAVQGSVGSGREDKSWKVGIQSRQTSPSVREGILGHHFGSVRKGVGVRSGGVVVGENVK